MSEHILVSLGKEYLSQSKNRYLRFVDDPESNAFLKDIEHYPHAFVLACCMDRQTKAERAWAIPYRIKQLLGSFDMNKLASVSKEEYRRLFRENTLHRFNDDMAEVFYDAVQLINTKYSGDASLIWANTPSSSTVVYRFLEFKGIGIKIATMATNILVRDFGVVFSDYYSIDISIDISPDVHVRRVLYRQGLIPENATTDQIIYKACELNPDFPGIIDYSVWEIGRNWCRPQNPDCRLCPGKHTCIHYKSINRQE